MKQDYKVSSKTLQALLSVRKRKITQGLQGDIGIWTTTTTFTHISGQVQLQAGDPNVYYQQFAQPQYFQPEQTIANADTGRQFNPAFQQAPQQQVVYQAAQPPQSQPQAQAPYRPKQV